MNQNRRVLSGLILFLLLPMLACTVPGIGGGGPAATPTPLGDTLSFLIPAYTANLDPGDTVPGTRLTYVGREGDAYAVTIDGLAATKRTGDSFIWSGVLAPGVYANYNLRLTTSLFGRLPVAGPVEIIVFSPEPEALASLAGLSPALQYNNVVVNYLIPAGRIIPGTTVSYVGQSVQGQGEQAARLAELAGVDGYPYLAIGDSLTWTGKLRPQIAIQYNLRVAAISEDGLRLAGTAEIWILGGSD